MTASRGTNLAAERERTVEQGQAELLQDPEFGLHVGTGFFVTLLFFQEKDVCLLSFMYLASLT